MFSFPKDLGRVVTSFWSDIGTPKALECLAAFKEERWADLVKLKVDPRAYDDSVSYFYDAAAVSLLRKCEDLPPSEDLVKKAYNTFWACEHKCFRTNERMKRYLAKSHADREYDSLYDPSEHFINTIIGLVQSNLRSLLGTFPNIINGKFGPGSTVADSAPLITVPDKITSVPTVTPSMVWQLFNIAGTQWSKLHSETSTEPLLYKLVRGGRFATVTKTAEERRPIEIGPSGNVFVQLGLGQHMKERLDKFGLSQVVAKDKHMERARQASIHRQDATIDSKSASDLQARLMVKLVSPTEWFENLDELRTSHIWLPEKGVNASGESIDGKWVLLEKFSSMGCGFTFELMTSILASICLAVSQYKSKDYRLGEEILVFGDDVIVPEDIVNDVVEVMKFFGYELNLAKSFMGEDRFRESCGGDFFDGQAVRPYYIKNLPTEPHELISLCNGINRLLHLERALGVDSSVFRRAWVWALRLIPNTIRECRGPKDLGDIVIHDDEEKWKTVERNGSQYVRCYRPIPKALKPWYWKDDVVLAAALLGHGDSFNGVVPREGVSGYKLSWVPIISSDWVPKGAAEPNDSLSRALARLSKAYLEKERPSALCA